MAVQFFRGPAFRGQLKQTQADLVSNLKDFGRKMMSEEEFEFWDEQPDERWLHQEPDEFADVKDVHHFLEGAQGWANLLLYGTDWAILQASQGSTFYTSDTALVRRISGRAPDFMPAGFLAWDYYFPISPTLCVMLRPNLGEDIALRPYRGVLPASNWTVGVANALQSYSAGRWLFGDGKWLSKAAASKNLQALDAANVKNQLTLLTPAPGLDLEALRRTAQSVAAKKIAEAQRSPFARRFSGHLR
jgi:hypothetical protein